MHLGGDEVDKSCWYTNVIILSLTKCPIIGFSRQSNKEIVQFMKAHNLTNYDKLESMYIEKLIKIVSGFHATPVGESLVCSKQ